MLESKSVTQTNSSTNQRACFKYVILLHVIYHSKAVYLQILYKIHQEEGLQSEETSKQKTTKQFTMLITEPLSTYSCTGLGCLKDY